MLIRILSPKKNGTQLGRNNCMWDPPTNEHTSNVIQLDKKFRYRNPLTAGDRDVQCRLHGDYNEDNGADDADDMTCERRSSGIQFNFLYAVWLAAFT